MSQLELDYVGSSRVPQFSSEMQESAIWPDERPAVCVRYAFKHYNSGKNAVNVLNNFNMTVTKGTIYCLFGHSGCGKSSLFSCLVGRQSLNAGKIWVLGKKLEATVSHDLSKRIGYMPQKVALCKELSIRETMLYFGWIRDMTTYEIETQLQFMLDFLDLPNENRLIKNLSGGQQKRVSFAITLMHNPELLILDQPTEGIDLLLRLNFWKYLSQITRNGTKTVIISTYSLEELKLANTVGLMHDGRLMAEESPQDLISMFNNISLREVFVKLSKKQDETPDTQELDDTLASPIKNIKEDLLIDEPNLGVKPVDSTRLQLIGSYINVNVPSTTKLQALSMKTLLGLRRSIITTSLIYVVSVLQVILFCLATNRISKESHIAIVNNEILIDISNQTCPVEEGCIFKNLSCRYLYHLQTLQNVKYYPDEESALNAMKAGNARCVLHFPKNFTDNFITRWISGHSAVENSFDQSEITAWLNLYDSQSKLELNRSLRESFRSFSQDLWNVCKKPENQTNSPDINKIFKEKRDFIEVQPINQRSLIVVNSEKCTVMDSTDIEELEGNCTTDFLSCRFLTYLQSRITRQPSFRNILLRYEEKSNFTVALNALKQNDTLGILFIPNNFTKAIVIDRQIGFKPKQRRIYDHSKVILLAHTSFFTKVLDQTYEIFLNDLWTACEASNSSQPINVSNTSQSQNISISSITDIGHISTPTNGPGVIMNNNAIKLGIVNIETEPLNRECRLSETCNYEDMIDRYLYYKTSNPKVQVEHYTNLDDALHALWTNHVFAVFYVTKDFLYTHPDVLKHVSGVIAGNHPNILDKFGFKIWFDMSNRRSLQSSLYVVYTNFSIDTGDTCHKKLGKVNEQFEYITTKIHRYLNTSDLQNKVPIANKILESAVECSNMERCNFNYMSCKYLRHLDLVDISKLPYARYSEKNILQDPSPKAPFLSITRKQTTLFPGRFKGEVYWNNLLRFTAGTVAFNCPRIFHEAYSTFLQDISNTCLTIPKIINIPFQYRHAIIGTANNSVRDFVVPGIILMIVHFLLAIVSSTKLTNEKVEGLFDRSLTAGLSSGLILFSHVITQLVVVMCGQTIIVITAAFLIFDISCRGFIGSVIILTILQGVCGICFGLAVSTICGSNRQSIISMLTIFSLNFLLSGIVCPIEGMPLFVQYISNFLPLTLAIASFRNIILRGYSLTESGVYLGFISTIFWICIFSTMCIIKFRRY